jgi:ribonuclease HI
VLNKDLWVQLAALLEQHRVTFQWVKGHAGHEYNEQCDELAKGEAFKFVR